MINKKKLKETADRVVEAYREHPMEMIVATVGALGAVGSFVHNITEARNASTWRREVKRRERKQHGKK